MAEVEQEAAKGWKEAEARARQLLGEKRFAEARLLVQPVVERWGMEGYADAARKLLGEIAGAESAMAKASQPSGGQAPSAGASESKPPPEGAQVAQGSVAGSDSVVAARGEWERFCKERAQWKAALAGVEERIGAWDFRGALAEADKLRLDDPALAGRLGQRREEILRMGRLKVRMVAAINQGAGVLDKRSLGLRGVNGPVMGADEEGITAKLPTGKEERHLWGQLGEKGAGAGVGRGPGHCYR